MPVAVRESPFSATASAKPTTMRTPQARVLKALVPLADGDPVWEWPLVTRAQLGVRAGYTAISGTVTRALDGLKEKTVRGQKPKSGNWVPSPSANGEQVWIGNGSGDPHLGLLALKYVEEVVLDIEGTMEVNYRATVAGIAAYKENQKNGGKDLPPLRDAVVCTNDRYKNQNEEKP